MDKGRLESFSDGIMAILITIMVFSIPLPEIFAGEELLGFIRSLGVFLVSFLVVGVQWMKHHYLFQHCKRVTGAIMWSNLIYLSMLSMMPLFTKWMIVNPLKVIPALGYDVVFFMMTVSFHFLQNTVYGEHGKAVMLRLRERRGIASEQAFFILMVIGIVGIVVLSLIFPAVSIVFFLGLPLVTSFCFLKLPDRHFEVDDEWMLV